LKRSRATAPADRVGRGERGHSLVDALRMGARGGRHVKRGQPAEPRQRRPPPVRRGVDEALLDRDRLDVADRAGERDRVLRGNVAG
jgi:hypothetical protein